MTATLDKYQTAKAGLERDIAFDEAVKVDDIVQIRWTNCYRFLIAKAQVVRVNAKTIAAKLLHSVSGTTDADGVPLQGHGWPMGHVIKVPRIFCTGYSVNNCFRGLSKWRVVDPQGVYAVQEVLAFSPVDAKLEALPRMYGCPLKDVDGSHVEATFLSLRVKHLSDDV